MAQTFYIKKDSLLPTLRMELINDGRFDFLRSYHFSNAVQNADVTFSMFDDRGNLKISKSPVSIYEMCPDCCDDGFVLEYKWKKRDVNECGQYKGVFEINFNGDTYESGVDYESGNLRLPITEELDIFIK